MPGLTDRTFWVGVDSFCYSTVRRFELSSAVAAAGFLSSPFYNVARLLEETEPPQFNVAAVRDDRHFTGHFRYDLLALSSVGAARLDRIFFQDPALGAGTITLSNAMGPAAPLELSGRIPSTQFRVRIENVSAAPSDITLFLTLRSL